MMSDHAPNRRIFLQAAAAGAAGSLWSATAPRAADEPARIKIRQPIHGGVLNHRHGQQTADGLTITVEGEAPAAERVTVNGAEAERSGNGFRAKVTLRAAETDIVAVSTAAPRRDSVSTAAPRREIAAAAERRPTERATEDRVRVVWDRHSFPRYRFSIDDNIFFLRDVAEKKYKSLFDCFYTKMLRELHVKYGVKFTVNIYYTTGEDFNLTQFPDRYRGEWRDNADWLKLAFHAHADKPDRPYQDAPPEKLIADLDRVAEQIHRFAGEASYAPPTVIHWGMTRQSAFKPLVAREVKALSGYFKMGGRYDVNYRWDDQHSEYLCQHDAWKDFESGIVFSRVDIVCNSVPVDKIASTLEPLTKDPNTAEIMDLFTHEQYFWPFYRNYLPDHPQRLDTALRWVTDHGYKPVLFHEGFLGGPA